MWVTSWVKRERHSILEWRVSGRPDCLGRGYPDPNCRRSNYGELHVIQLSCAQGYLKAVSTMNTIVELSNSFLMRWMRSVWWRQDRQRVSAILEAQLWTLPSTTRLSTHYNFMYLLGNLFVSVLSPRMFAVAILKSESSEWDMGIHSHLERSSNAKATTTIVHQSVAGYGSYCGSKSLELVKWDEI